MGRFGVKTVAAVDVNDRCVVLSTVGINKGFYYWFFVNGLGYYKKYLIQKLFNREIGTFLLFHNTEIFYYIITFLY